MKQNPKAIRAQKDGKVPMELIPYGALAAVARVLAGGAAKYGRRNWMVDEIQASTYHGSMNRHLNLEWAQGDDVDADSGEHPLAHVAAACLLVMEAEANGMLIDDRDFAESLSQTPPSATEIKQRQGEWVPPAAEALADYISKLQDDGTKPLYFHDDPGPETAPDREALTILDIPEPQTNDDVMVLQSRLGAVKDFGASRSSMAGDHRSIDEIAPGQWDAARARWDEYMARRPKLTPNDML